MKKQVFLCVMTLVVMFGMVGGANALSIYVDSAPNVYGSASWPAWWEASKASASEGTFNNMESGSNSANAGTTNFEIEDAVVYSFGDLGRRMHFVYWLPGETLDTLQGKNRFAASMYYEWDGITYDFYNEYYGQTWLEPTKWENYDLNNDNIIDGVIGSAGFAWWGAYGSNTQASLDADLADWDQHQGDIIFRVRYGETISEITAHHEPTPEPTTLILLGLGLIGVASLKKRFRQ